MSGGNFNVKFRAENGECVEALARKGARLKTRGAIISCLFVLTFVLVAAQTAETYFRNSRWAKEPSISRVARLMDSYGGNSSENKSAQPVPHDSSEQAIRALLDKECEVAVTSRKMRINEAKEAENRGMEIREAIAGLVGVAIAVHPTNPISELTVDQIGKIIAGEYTRWNEVGGMPRPILIVTPANYRTGMMEFLAQTFPKASLGQVATQTQHPSEEPNAVALIRSEPNGFEAESKILAIKKDEKSQGILPSKEAIQCGIYPFRLPLYAYVDWKSATGATKAFFDFCAGQANRTPCK
jgi:ABC-type phosphate transport system substrate-binding protein